VKSGGAYMVTIKEKRDNGIVLFQMKSDQLTVEVTNLGCHVRAIYMEDKNGQIDDVVLGVKDVEDIYHDEKYLGALVGRVANRIGGASFVLNGKTYNLAANNTPNCLHGGNKGFDQKLFDYELENNKIIFSYVSPDMEEGFPGMLTLVVVYQLEGDTLTIMYHAVSDQDTICNFTNHSYFNLNGNKHEILDHKLKIEADQIMCIDSTGCTTGEYLDVSGTPFDFREFHKIGERINDDNAQIKLGGGYDHHFVFCKGADQVQLFDEESGRKLTISTTLPGAQVYTANFLAGGMPGKNGENKDRYAVAIETQLMPNSINLEEEPSVILRKGKSYKESTSYKFEVVK
jgi:aldose 1-epimerase